MPWYSAYLLAERSPEMGQLTSELLEAWFNQVGGGELFNHYNFTGQITPWGALESQNQALADAPKYQALVDFAALPVPEPGSLGLLTLGGVLLLRRHRPADAEIAPRR